MSKAKPETPADRFEYGHVFSGAIRRYAQMHAAERSKLENAVQDRKDLEKQVEDLKKKSGGEFDALAGKLVRVLREIKARRAAIPAIANKMQKCAERGAEPYLSDAMAEAALAKIENEAEEEASSAGGEDGDDGDDTAPFAYETGRPKDGDRGQADDAADDADDRSLSVVLNENAFARFRAKDMTRFGHVRSYLNDIGNNAEGLLEYVGVTANQAIKVLEAMGLGADVPPEWRAKSAAPGKPEVPEGVPKSKPANDKKKAKA